MREVPESLTIQHLLEGKNVVESKVRVESEEREVNYWLAKKASVLGAKEKWTK